MAIEIKSKIPDSDDIVDKAKEQIGDSCRIKLGAALGNISVDSLLPRKDDEAKAAAAEKGFEIISEEDT